MLDKRKMKLIGAYWDYELGTTAKIILSGNREISIKISTNRNHKNPFYALFPYLLKVEGQKIIVSISNKEILDYLLVELQDQPVDEVVILDLLQKYYHGQAKTLHTYRYISLANDQNLPTTEATLFTPKEIDSLSSICKIEADILFRLNREQRLFGQFDNEEALACGIFTRVSQHWSEISVVTDKLYRRKGLGRKVVSQMLRSINESRRNMIYVCEVENVPSNRLALSLELFDLGEEYMGYMVIKGEQHEE